MERQMLEHSLPKLTVGTIGAVGSGKSTLAAALVAVMAKVHGGQSNELGKPHHLAEKVEGIADCAPRVQYQTSTRHYTQVDCPGGAEDSKSLLLEIAHMNAAILVVSASDGLSSQTREHLLLALQGNVRHMVVFISKADLVGDAEQLQFVELAVRELLAAYRFAAKRIPVIVGSALNAIEGDSGPFGMPAIIKLAKEMDRHIPLPKHEVDIAFS
jgi:elongation factor Tu